MNNDTPFPEIQSTTDPKTIPWHMAVVWSDRFADGKRVYEFLGKEHIRLVNWSGGILSVELQDGSPVGRDVMYFILQAPFVAIGKNIPV